MSKDPIYKNAFSKSQIKTNAYCKKAFFYDFDGEESAVLQNTTNEIMGDLNRDFKSRFDVNFISQVTKPTKPSNIEKENFARAFKKILKLNGNRSL